MSVPMQRSRISVRLARRRGGLMIRFTVLRQVTHETKGP